MLQKGVKGGGQGPSRWGLLGWTGGVRLEDRPRGPPRHAGTYFHHHLRHEDGCEDVVRDAEEDTLLQGQVIGRGWPHPGNPTPSPAEEGASRCFLGQCRASPGQW